MDEVIQCNICGRNTFNTGTRLCDNCWEVDCRLSSLNLKAVRHFIDRLKSIEERIK